MEEKRETNDFPPPGVNTAPPDLIRRVIADLIRNLRLNNGTRTCLASHFLSATSWRARGSYHVVASGFTDCVKTTSKNFGKNCPNIDVFRIFRLL